VNLAMPSNPADPLAAELTRIIWNLHRVIGQVRKPPAEIPSLRPPAQIELLILVEQRRGVTVREAAAALAMQPNNVSSLVSHLVKDGLLERTQDPQDRRQVRLYPTQRMLRAGERINQGLYDEMQRALGGLPARSVERIRAALPELRALAEQLSPQGSDSDGGGHPGDDNVGGVPEHTPAP
jgi:DNA-binding MarR family transcriptional regulator